MYWEKRGAAEEMQYCFIYWDPIAKTNIRIKQSDVPQDIETDAQADAFCRLKEAETEASKLRIARKLAWQKKFYDFEELLEIFEKEVQKRAPNSWQGQLYYLKQYGLDFFLNKKQSNNLNNWSLYFEEFRDWLLTVKTGKTTQSQRLAYSSRNNVIGSVNIFLDIMFRKGKCELQPKCQKFPRHLLNRRDAEDVISTDEVKIITALLQESDETYLASDFFTVLLNSGLRLGEGLGLSLADFFPGAPDSHYTKGSLERHSLMCLGYISLESQLTNSRCPRSFDKTIPRKPLKGRKRIDSKASRMIPIFDRKTFNVLARRYNEQSALMENKQFGSNKSDYLLFDGLTRNIFFRLITKAYEKSKFKNKSAHCARHTFATNLAGMTNADTGLCRLVLGHRDEDTTLGYVHLFEQINRQARANVQVKNKIELVAE